MSEFDYDLRLVNGKIIDFYSGKVTIGDVYIKDGVFIEGTEIGKSQFTIDAAGKYILPGLVDEHCHLNYNGSNIGTNADLLCIPMGVTTAVDAGTTGWTNYEGFYRNNIVRYVPNVFTYLHVSPYGVHSGVIHEENHDPADFNEKEIIRKAVQYKDNIVGLKVRMCKATLGNYGVAPLKRTVEIANAIEKQTGKKCTVDVHYDNLPDNVTVEDVFSTVRPGDVVSHVMQTHGETIFNEDGSVQQSVLNARKRGVWMDDCHGRVHWSFSNLKKAFAAGFIPDIISSDVVRISTYVRPGSSLIHAMIVDSAAGLDELSIFKAVTYTPAKALGILDKAGTLDIGKPADVCVMDVQDFNTVLDDFWDGSCKANKAFIPMMTIKDGVIVYRQPNF